MFGKRDDLELLRATASRKGFLTPEEILSYFYGKVLYTRGPKGWKTAFDTERLKGVKLVYDLIDAATGEKVADLGTKMTPRLGKKLRDAGLTEIVVAPEDLVGQYLSEDIINEQTGEIFAEAGDELTAAVVAELEKLGIT